VLDTESSEFSHLWIPAFAGMTVFGLLTSSSNKPVAQLKKGVLFPESIGRQGFAVRQP